MKEVSLEKLAAYFELENLTPEIPLKGISVNQDDINRPALQLAGFYQYFDNDRIQLYGQVEEAYMNTKTPQEAAAIWKELFARRIPCLVLCRGLTAPAAMLEAARNAETPVFSTRERTTHFMGRILSYLHTELAPQISMHGVLVDIYGEGVLITGESGIGKSETALELIRRGHRLVADDMVDVYRIGDDQLIGMAPEVLRYFVELRGIGIVNVREIYGVEAVKESMQIDMIIRLEPGEKVSILDRVGAETRTTPILGKEVDEYVIPIHAGRNLAVIIETATVNHRSRKLGYNAAAALSEQVNRNIARRAREREDALRKQQENNHHREEVL